MKISQVRQFSLGLVALCVALAGCATVRPDPAYKAPPEKNVYAFGAPAENTTPVVFKRDATVWGSACSNTILVDGVRAATLSPGELITLHIQVGERILGAKRPGGICGGRVIEMVADIKPKHRIKYRLTIDSLGDLAFMPTGI